MKGTPLLVCGIVTGALSACAVFLPWQYWIAVPKMSVIAGVAAFTVTHTESGLKSLGSFVLALAVAGITCNGIVAIRPRSLSREKGGRILVGATLLFGSATLFCLADLVRLSGKGFSEESTTWSQYGGADLGVILALVMSLVATTVTLRAALECRQSSIDARGGR